jgi:hypothetical protein
MNGNGINGTNGSLVGKIVPWIVGSLLAPLALAFISLLINNTSKVATLETRNDIQEKRLERIELKIDELTKHVRGWK